jgi:hypothetical protein
VAADGGIFTFGDAVFNGSPGGTALGEPIFGMASAAGGNGYWLLDEDGAVYRFGTAIAYGSPAGNAGFDGAATSITSTADGLGYWITDADGDVFAYGDAMAYAASS